ncbi:hypothetical protein NEMBOFW57_007369 [Staphylotrichum longicolle]|uniref:Uncharacterized protein n=1 Tax=Staphylotrichum longicolle TaxID=669026 RepID=A0AAD4HXD1_9PEZI|nr:hypothetical protein NEMBOFW57_007369 [Staphylotrichum longicolle]
MASLFRSKEELGKKDDDHKPAGPSMRTQWIAATGGPRRKLKRLVIVLGLAAFVYLFIRNLPTDVPVRDRRRPVYRPETEPNKPPAPGPMPKLKPDRTPLKPLPPYKPPPDTVPPPAAYNGPLLFQNLLPSLQGISSTGGASTVNKNVLFAAASLRSTAMLLPLACQMANELKNYVHFALVGGSDIDMDKLRAVNGIDASCQVMFHDAHHINNYMHPQAMIIDASGLEEDYFLTSMRKQAPDSGIPLIELPENSVTQLAWISKLDSSSLAGQKWIELHGLVSNLLDFQHKAQSIPSFFTNKLVSKKYPSWLEHALKLARARGYWTLYPSAVAARHLATVHSELYRAPEEYETEFAKESAGNSEFPIDGATLLENLPGGGKLLGFDEMPLLHWDGQATPLTGLDEAALGYAKEFRQAVGGCQTLTADDLLPKMSTKDLFCMKDK